MNQRRKIKIIKKFSILISLIAIILPSGPAQAVYQCGGVQDTCPCGGNNPYPCCDNDGNCTWYAWHSACCHWGMALPGWGNAKTWAQYAAANANFEVLPNPVPGAIACRTSGTYGHVAYVVSVSGANITVEEENCCSTCAGGVRTWTYAASYFDGGFIVPRGGVTPPECEVAIDGTPRIIDENTDCFERHGQYWWDVSDGYDGHHFYTYATDDSAPDSWAAWRFNVTVPGDYEIAVHVPASTLERTQNAVYRVSVAGGESTHAVNQAAVSGWVTLGRFHLASGTSQFVRLDDNTGEAYALRRVLLFDAVSVAPVTACSDECTEGDVRCEGTEGYRICARPEGSTCTAWGPVAFCGTDRSCIEGECVPDSQGCIDDCLAAGRFCSGAHAYVECGQFDTDPCMDQSAAADCPDGQECFGGNCRAVSPDAGADSDSDADGSHASNSSGGCSCRAAAPSGGLGVPLLLLLFVLAMIRRRRI